MLNFRTQLGLGLLNYSIKMKGSDWSLWDMGTFPCMQ